MILKTKTFTIYICSYNTADDISNSEPSISHQESRVFDKVLVLVVHVYRNLYGLYGGISQIELPNKSLAGTKGICRWVNIFYFEPSFVSSFQESNSELRKY